MSKLLRLFCMPWLLGIVHLRVVGDSHALTALWPPDVIPARASSPRLLCATLDTVADRTPSDRRRDSVVFESDECRSLPANARIFIPERECPPLPWLAPCAVLSLELFTRDVHPCMAYYSTGAPTTLNGYGTQRCGLDARQAYRDNPDDYIRRVARWRTLYRGMLELKRRRR